MLAFATEQTPFLQYLQTDTFELLSAEERDYLQYLALVVFEAFRQNASAKQPELTGQRIESLEEQHWDWMQATVGKPMRDRLDIFYDKIDEEELLAFAEDSLIDPDQQSSEAIDDELEAVLFDSGASRELALVALSILIGGLST